MRPDDDQHHHHPGCPNGRPEPARPHLRRNDVPQSAGPIEACGHCGFARCDSPAQLSRILSRTAVGYERVVWAAYTASPPDQATQSLLDQIVRVRDAQHGYANRLGRLAELDNPVFADLDPEVIQPVALDHTLGGGDRPGHQHPPPVRNY